MKKVTSFGAAGIVIVVLVVAALMVSDLLPIGAPSQGTLIVKLTDAQVELKHLNVTITSLAVQMTDGNNETG